MVQCERPAKGTVLPMRWGWGECISPDIKDQPPPLPRMKLMGVDTMGEEWHPLDNHQEVEDDHPGGPGGGGGNYDPNNGGDDEGEDDESVMSFGEQRGRVRHQRVTRRERLVLVPGGGPLDEPDPDYDDPYAWMRGLRH